MPKPASFPVHFCTRRQKIRICEENHRSVTQGRFCNSPHPLSLYSKTLTLVHVPEPCEAKVELNMVLCVKANVSTMCF